MLATGKSDYLQAAMVVIAFCCCLLACSGRQRQLDVASLPALDVAGASVAAAQKLSQVAIAYPLALDADTELVDTYVDRDARPEDQVRYMLIWQGFCGQYFKRPGGRLRHTPMGLDGHL